MKALVETGRHPVLLLSGEMLIQQMKRIFRLLQRKVKNSRTATVGAVTCSRHFGSLLHPRHASSSNIKPESICDVVTCSQCLAVTFLQRLTLCVMTLRCGCAPSFRSSRHKTSLRFRRLAEADLRRCIDVFLEPVRRVQAVILCRWSSFQSRDCHTGWMNGSV